MRGRRRVAAAGLPVATVLGAVAAAPSARAEWPPPPRTDSKWLTPAEKRALNSPAYHLAHEIADRAQFREHGDGERGYAGIGYDVGRNSVDLWWKGRLDADVARLVASGRRHGVTVAVHPSRFTRLFVHRAMVRLISGPELRAAGITPLRGGSARDMSGLHLEIRRGWPDPPEQRAMRVRQISLDVTGVPVLTVRERCDGWEPRHLDGPCLVLPGGRGR